MRINRSMGDKLYKLFVSFISDITEVFPEQTTGCIAAREHLTNDPDSFIRDVYAHIVKYDEEIVARNNEYFNVRHSEIIPGVFIGDYWNEISEKSKQTVWRYLNLLLLLCAKYIRKADKKKSQVTTNTRTTVAKKEEAINSIMESLKDIPESNFDMTSALNIVSEMYAEFKDSYTLNTIEHILEKAKADGFGSILDELGLDESSSVNPVNLVLNLLMKPELFEKVQATSMNVMGVSLKEFQNNDVDLSKMVSECMDCLQKYRNKIAEVYSVAGNMIDMVTSKQTKSNIQMMLTIFRNMDVDDMMRKMRNSFGKSSAVRDRLRRTLQERKNAKATSGAGASADSDTQSEKTNTVTEETITEQVKKANAARSKKKPKKKHRKTR